MSLTPSSVVTVDLGERSYDITVAPGLLDEIGPRVLEVYAPTRVALIADETVGSLYAGRVLASLTAAGLEAHLLTFPAGEESKSLARLEELAKSCLALHLDRKSLLLALGGGVTGDLAGCLAALWMRGVAFMQIPTTLLAQVDSSSGGKTGVNLPGGKNLIGAFHQPRAVFIDPQTLGTLSPGELGCGLGEVVKHGMIRDAAYFEMIESGAEAIQTLSPALISEVILGSCRIKAAVVAADEREGGLRAILNFGHTFAHAWETLSQYAIRHGHAVSAGMVAACHLGERVCATDPAVRARLVKVLKALGLPTTAPSYPLADVLAAMADDKKAEAGRIKFVLPTTLGEVRIVPLDDMKPVAESVRQVMA